MCPLFFIFSTKWKPFKTYEKCFLFHLKSSFCSWDFWDLIFLSLTFHTFQIKKGKWKWNNFGVMNWLAYISRCNFWKSKTKIKNQIQIKNCFTLHHQTWSGNTSIIKGFFWTCFSPFFNCYLAAPQPTLSHYQGSSLIQLMLITVLSHFWLRVTKCLITSLGP